MRGQVQGRPESSGDGEHSSISVFTDMVCRLMIIDAEVPNAGLVIENGSSTEPAKLRF